MLSRTTRVFSILVILSLPCSVALSQEAQYCFDQVWKTCCDASGALNKTRTCGTKPATPCPDIPVLPNPTVGQLVLGNTYDGAAGPAGPPGTCTYYRTSCNAAGQCVIPALPITAGCSNLTGAGSCGSDTVD